MEVAPCHVIAIALCHLSLSLFLPPLLLLPRCRNAHFRDTIFSSQSPPSPPPLSLPIKSVRPVSLSKLLLILAPTQVFVFVSSCKTRCGLPSELSFLPLI